MKKYFTKYLPVEREIKEGDKVLHKGEILTTSSYDSWFTKWDFVEKSIAPVDYETPKLLKLFLCSRDIQVGDKVVTELPIPELNINEFDKGTVISLGTRGFNVKSENITTHWGAYHTIKIIGEISTEAIWAEGMKFDENEVNFQASDNLPFEEFIDISEHEYYLHTNYPLKRIQLKCPTCEHFH